MLSFSRNADPGDKTLPGSCHTKTTGSGGDWGREKSQSSRLGLFLGFFALMFIVYTKAKISNYAHSHQDNGFTELSVV